VIAAVAGVFTQSAISPADCLYRDCPAALVVALICAAYLNNAAVLLVAEIA
jgi:hypothetical protein